MTTPETSPFAELEELFAARGAEAQLPKDRKHPDDPIELRPAGYTDFVRMVAQGHIDNVTDDTRALAGKFLSDMRGP